MFSGDPCFLGNWEEDGQSFLFFSKPALELVCRRLERVPEVHLEQHFDVDYQDWLGGRLKPLSVGRLTIVPAWEEAPEKDHGPAIRFDPGVVFGSGIHPTTRFCLFALERVLSMARIDLVADLGSGTGLLSLAAAALGANRSVAVDVNPLAARTTRSNIRINGLEKRILAVQGRAEHFAALPAELLVANIHFDIMRHLAEGEELWSREWLILSGVLPKQAAWLQDRFSQRSAEVVATWGWSEGWPTFLLRRGGLRREAEPETRQQGSAS
jgi:ribosomal protein L11 methyltransferase